MDSAKINYPATTKKKRREYLVPTKKQFTMVERGQMYGRENNRGSWDVGYMKACLHDACIALWLW
jgi:hypothetical protein